MKISDLEKISNPDEVKRKFLKYKSGDDAVISISPKSDKKYRVTYKGKAIHFGSKMEDYTKHKDETRRESYLKRSNAIPGDWRDNKYSPNNLSRNLLW